MSTNKKPRQNRGFFVYSFAVTVTPSIFGRVFGAPIAAPMIIGERNRLFRFCGDGEVLRIVDIGVDRHRHHVLQFRNVERGHHDGGHALDGLGKLVARHALLACRVIDGALGDAGVFKADFGVDKGKLLHQAEHGKACRLVRLFLVRIGGLSLYRLLHRLDEGERVAGEAE